MFIRKLTLLLGAALALAAGCSTVDPQVCVKDKPALDLRTADALPPEPGYIADFDYYRIARYVLRVVPDAGKLTARTQIVSVPSSRMDFSRTGNTVQQGASRRSLRA